MCIYQGFVLCVFFLGMARLKRTSLSNPQQTADLALFTWLICAKHGEQQQNYARLIGKSVQNGCSWLDYEDVHMDSYDNSMTSP